MRFLIAVIITVFAMPSFAADKVSAVAQGNPFYLDSFAIIDIQKILDESKASKSARDQVSALKKKYTDEANAEGRKLSEMEKQIKSQQKALSPEAFGAKVRDFQNKVKQDQIIIAKKRKILQAAYAKSLGLIRDTVVTIVAEIAKERDIDLVLAKGNILFSKNGVDITKDVLDHLDKRLSKVTINIQKK